MSWTQERARVASLSRSRTPNDPDLVAARQNLKTELLANYISRSVDAAPTLTQDQLNRLAGLLRVGTAA